MENGELIVNEDGSVHIPNENVDKFNKEINELMDYETNLILEGIPMEDVEKCDLEKYDSLTLEEVYSIEKIINDPIKEYD